MPAFSITVGGGYPHSAAPSLYHITVKEGEGSGLGDCLSLIALSPQNLMWLQHLGTLLPRQRQLQFQYPTVPLKGKILRCSPLPIAHPCCLGCAYRQTEPRTDTNPSGAVLFHPTSLSSPVSQLQYHPNCPSTNPLQ